MLSSLTGPKNNIIQARKIALAGSYDNQTRLIKDAGMIFHKYPKLYPTENQIKSLTGNTCQLQIQGNIDLINPTTFKDFTVKIKITFVKDYPKTRPTICLENPNEQLFEANPAYLSTKLARYERSIKDGRMYLYLEFVELRGWTVNSDIIVIMQEVEKRLSQNNPYLNRNNAIKESKATTHINFRNDLNPELRKQLMKTKQQLSELENDFETLSTYRNQLVVSVACSQVIDRQLNIKVHQLSSMSKKINQLASEYSKSSLDASSVDQIIKCNDASRKLLLLLSQKQALQQCLQYLKDQLKNGARISDLNQSFKRLFQQFFSIQLQLNQL